MIAKNPPIDAYIAKSAAFAKPILTHLRKLVHQACPTAEEKIKWSFPHFDYKGEMMCSMAAFKQHCVFGFWKAALMKDKLLMKNARSEVAMGHLGKITTLKDLPPDKKIIAWIKEAMQLNDQGLTVQKTKPLPATALTIPDYFSKAVKKNKKAWNTFDAFSPSAKKEYVQWVTEAKAAETRNKRLMQAIEWMAEGKPRNWKYMKQYQ
jgi:uncharacterized protein YdeI (YjbR/CyaY-like superfamily)